MKTLKSKKIFIILVASIVVLVGVAFVGIKIVQKKNKITTCMVQFESSGGSKINFQEVEKGMQIVEPEPPTKEGFTFIEWQLNGEKFDFNRLVTEDIILTAVWEANPETVICIVTFDSDGGSKIEPIEAAQGSTITAPLAPQKSGFTFKGWFQEDEKFDFSTIINENMVLKAKWKEGETKIVDKSIDISEGVVTTASNEIKSNSSLDDINEIVSDYIGTWYLEGYSDVYIMISKHEYVDATCMDIVGINVSSDTFDIYTLFKGKQTESFGYSIRYDNFKDNLKQKGITLNVNSIVFKKNNSTLVFIKNRGNKDKYDYFGAIYKRAEGTWYLYNNPNTIINVEITKNPYSGIQYDVNCDSYTITSTYGGEIEYIGREGCNATDNSLFNKYGITVDGNKLNYNYNGVQKVFYKNPTYISIDEIIITPNTLTMHVGDTKELNVSINPQNAFYKGQGPWDCSNNSVIRRQGNTIEAIGIGEATISYRVTGYDKEYYGYCTVQVLPINVESISLNKSDITISRGDSETLYATIYPTNATNKNIIWSSSNSDIASVNSSGVVTGKGIGTATITAKTEDGGYTSSCNITVNIPPLSVDGNIGISTRVSNNEISSGVYVEAIASGGTGVYSYNIKLYYEGSLLLDTQQSYVFFNNISNGTYSATITVTDSNGESKAITKTITKS